jgi:hypothetical protein
VSLGFASRAGPRGTLPGASSAPAMWTRDEASAAAGHIVSMSLQIQILVQRA